MAQFKIDENLPRAVKQLLVSRGHDAMTVADQDLVGAVDDVLGDVCRTEGRVLLTLDRGFGDPRRHAPEGGPGIIILRPSSQDATAVLDLLGRLLPLLADGSPKSALWIVEEDRVRVRRGRSGE